MIAISHRFSYKGLLTSQVTSLEGYYTCQFSPSQETFSYKEVWFKNICLPIKNNFLPTEIV